MRSLIVTVFALSMALAVRPAAAQDDSDVGAQLEASMAAAQAQAIRPGDETLTCEQLEGEIVSTIQDPAVQEVIAASGADAQTRMDQMNALAGRARAQAGVSMFMGLASAFVPVLGDAQMLQQRAMAAQQQRQAQQNIVEMMQMSERMSSIMPQMMRSQRVYELGQAQQCEFTQQQAQPQQEE